MVKVQRTRIGGDIVVDITGHAGYAPCGQDIVCASLSSAAMLLGRTALALGLRPVEKMMQGHFVLFIDDSGVIGTAITDAFMEHIGVLAQDFPECVSIEDKCGADGGTAGRNTD